MTETNRTVISLEQLRAYCEIAAKGDSFIERINDFIPFINPLNMLAALNTIKNQKKRIAELELENAELRAKLKGDES